MRLRDFDDDDCLPVMVPRSDKALVQMSAARVRRLRGHLLGALHTMKDPMCSSSPLRPEPEGFAARVARTACSLCKGWCCRNGGDDGFLDDRTMARVRPASRIWMSARCCGCISIACRRLPTRTRVYFMGNEVARWTGPCALMFATAIFAAASALI
jgi:hypothetical protein